MPLGNSMGEVVPRLVKWKSWRTTIPGDVPGLQQEVLDTAVLCSRSREDEGKDILRLQQSSDPKIVAWTFPKKTRGKRVEEGEY